MGKLGAMIRNRPALRIYITALVTVALLAACVVCILLFTDFSKKSESLFDCMTVNSIDSGHKSISVSVSDAEFEGFAPYIKIRWTNNSDRVLLYGDDFTIIKSENKENSSEETGKEASERTHTVQNSASSERIYYISPSLIKEKGDYRFETSYILRGSDGKAEEFTAIISFTAEYPAEASAEHHYTVKKKLYDDGSAASAESFSSFESIRITADRFLFVKSADKWLAIGELSDISLTEDNFDKRVLHYEVTDQISVRDIRANNKMAWQIKTDDGSGDMYILIRQNDGTLIFGKGKYGTSDASVTNSDASSFLWLCSVQEK